MGTSRPSLGLGARTGLAVLLVVAALGALAYGMASAALANQTREAQRAVVMTIAGAFAAGFEESALGQEAEMRERVDGLRDRHPELREATVVTARPGGAATALVSTTRGRQHGPVSPAEVSPIASAVARYEDERPGDQHVAKLSYPLREGSRAPVGALSLTYDLAAYDQALERRRRLMALVIGVGALALALLGWALLARGIAGAVRDLHAAARQLREGERGVRLEWARRDEVGDLARDLDELAADLEATEARVQELTLVDDLTGLLNYQGMEDALGAELRRAQRWGYRVAIVSVDVDHLAQINAGWGEDAGDEALRLVGGKIASDVRAGDLCARIGEDEFLIALTQTGGSEAEDVVHRLRAAVSGVEFVPTGWSLTVSAGIAQFPYDAADPVELMRLAQWAMRRSKSDGGDRCTVYTPDADSGLYV